MYTDVSHRLPMEPWVYSKQQSLGTKLSDITSTFMHVVACCPLANVQSARRGRGRGNRSRGRVNMRRDGPMKFEEDFDFETANAQFHKDELDKELQSKLKLKGEMSSASLMTNTVS